MEQDRHRLVLRRSDCLPTSLCRNEGYLTRTWLVDPRKAETIAGRNIVTRGSEIWNGRDFYVAVGEEDGVHRTWDDCRTYGFVSGGHGTWYSNSLSQLFPGARIFAMVPKWGYVGVGIVKDEVRPIRDFQVEHDGRTIPIVEAPLKAKNMGEDADDPALSEYLVRVEWLATVPKEKAFWMKGFFANQNTVCKLRRQFTIEHVAKHFGVED